MTDDHGRLRISNADREKAIEQLQAALDEGRIDLSEFDERTVTVYAAKTNAELDLIFDDLPGGRPKEGELQAAEPEAEHPAAGVHHHPQGRRNPLQEIPALRALILVGTICTAIWLVSGLAGQDGFGNFWPIWPILGLSIATCMQLMNRGRWH